MTRREVNTMGIEAARHAGASIGFLMPFCLHGSVRLSRAGRRES